MSASASPVVNGRPSTTVSTVLARAIEKRIELCARDVVNVSMHRDWRRELDEGFDAIKSCSAAFPGSIRLRSPER
jgi:hypothetical protein